MVGQLHALAAADVPARERARIAEVLRDHVGHLHTELARKYAAELSFDLGSVVGEVEAPQPTPLSLFRELVADGHSFATTVLDVQARLLSQAASG